MKSKKTNFDGIKDKKAKWPNEVMSWESKPFNTGMLKCILLFLLIVTTLFLFIGQDYIINFFTK